MSESKFELTRMFRVAELMVTESPPHVQRGVNNVAVEILHPSVLHVKTKIRWEIQGNSTLRHRDIPIGYPLSWLDIEAQLSAFLKGFINFYDYLSTSDISLSTYPILIEPKEA